MKLATNILKNVSKVIDISEAKCTFPAEGYPRRLTAVRPSLVRASEAYRPPD